VWSLACGAGGGGDRDPEFYANVGLAVRTLRAELPRVFEQELSLDIYTDDVGFVDEISPQLARRAFSAASKEEYAKLTWSLRFHGWLFFQKVKVELHRIWQPQQDTISVRWTVRGVPRLLGYLMSPQNSSYIDGISEYKVNSQGKIYEHKVSNLDWDTGLKLHLATMSLNSLQVPGLTPAQPQTPTPSFLRRRRLPPSGAPPMAG